MSFKTKGILIITPTCYPDVGGVETHLADLIYELSKKSELKIFVATHKPIVTNGVKFYRKKEIFANVIIYRFWWFGWNLFHFFEKYPLLQFLYLCPYLSFRALILMLFNKKKIDIIHGQGLTGAYVGIVFKKIFKKKLIVSTHAVYEIDENSIVAKLVKYVLDQADKILCLSKASYNELISLRIDKEKLSLFRYWINLGIFKPLNKKQLRNELKIEDKFTILFVGRLIEKKGIKILVEVAKQLPIVNFVFVGVGPEEGYLKEQEQRFKNIKYIGMVPNYELCKYYNIADIFCIPSQYQEGFGRVIMEAISCGIPVVGSDLGGIPEAIDESISVLVKPTVNNFKKAIEDLYHNREKLDRLAKNCFSYSRKNFSKENIELITKYY